MSNEPPVILLVYANDRVDPANHLRSLADEIGLIRDTLQPAKQAGHCEVLIEGNASAERVFAVFQDAQYRNRIAILHYAGHADGYRLLLESAAGGASSARGAAQAAGLAAFLGEQRGLELVFLNGCSTAPQVEGLLQANCPAVIATSQAIDDRVAMDFAVHFYRGLGGGVGLETAFKEAVAATRTTRGDNPRGLYWGSPTDSAAPTDRWPWELRIKPGAERAAYWNLPEVVGDPLFGLPALPMLDLPQSPFRHLDWFARKHALVFFGRAFQVRALYDRITAPDAAPILLVHGESGVGKSSVLAAGLLPRLEASHRVHYLRRDAQRGLLGSLMQPLGADLSAAGAAWRQAEANADAPLLVVLDQVEEVFTRPLADQPAELATFLDGLTDLFGRPEARPRGRLILSFRKEWLPEIDKRLEERELPRERLFLEGLDRRGVIAAVNGVKRDERLRIHYGLDIDDGLAEEIADDLRADPQSPIAPTLQILLTKLWSEAKRLNDDQPHFTRNLYLGLKREGILLKDFLDQQLTALEQWRPTVVQSGLALDLLAFHTTPRGTAAQCLEQALLTTYAHVKEGLPELVQRCKDTYLLADIPTAGQEPIKGTRLAHDTLAPLVRARFEESDRPGQRARRILDNRGVEWTGGRSGATLDETDLSVVEGGVDGMRAWTADELRLLSDSRAEAERHREEAQRAARDLEEARQAAEARHLESKRHARTAVARLQAFQAQAQRNLHPIRALLLAAESVKRPLEQDEAALGGPESVLRDLIGATGGIPLSGRVLTLGVDPQGRWLATGDLAATVRLWDLSNPRAAPRTLRGHEEKIWTLTFDAQGRWLATGSQDDTARLWDLQNLDADPRVLRGHGAMVSALAFDPQGRWLASGGWDKTVRLWSLQTPAAEPLVLRGFADQIETIACDPQGRWLAPASADQTQRLWDLGDPSAVPRVLDGHADKITTLAFDPGGRWLATGGDDKTARLWDLQNLDAEPRVLPGHASSVGALAFDPQGRRLATGSSDNTASLWDLQDAAAAPRVLRGHEDSVSALAFDPQGRWLASGSWDKTVRLWSLEDTGAEPRVLRGHDGPISILAFDPQGRWLATRGDDWAARLWDLAAPAAEPRVLPGPQSGLQVRAIAIDTQGRWLAAGGRDGTARLWSLQDVDAGPRVFQGHEGVLSAIALDPPGRRLATGGYDGTVRLWVIEDQGGEPRVLRGHAGKVSVLAFDPLDHWLVTGGKDGITRLWSLQDAGAEPRMLPGHAGGVTAIAFDDQGRRLATSGCDGTVRLFDLQDLEAQPLVLQGHGDEVATLAFDPQDRWLASGGYDRTVRLWGLEHPESEPLVLRTDDIVVMLAFDPAGRWLAAGEVGGEVRLWDPADPGSEPRVLRGHTELFWVLAFDPQGRRLATGSRDKTVRLWDLDHPDAEPQVLRGHTGAVWALAFDPAARRLATGGEDGTVRLWQLEIPALLDLACATAGRNLTLEEWREHVGDVPYRVTCPQFPSDETLAAKAASGAP